MVPRQEKWSMPSSSDQTGVGRTLTLGGGAESSLEGRDIELSVSPKDIRTSPYDLCANRSDRRQSREGDRWFESTPSSGESGANLIFRANGFPSEMLVIDHLGLPRPHEHLLCSSGEAG